jgi:uncharacterized protein (TIGR03437 family)
MSRRILALAFFLGLFEGVFAQADFRVVVSPTWPWPAAILGEFFKLTYSTTGGYPEYGPWIVSTDPPPGLKFDAATGVLSGNPTAVGNYKFSIAKRCCNGNGSSGTTSDIKVVGPLTINTTAIPSVYAGAAYSFQFIASGGVPPYAWSIPLLSVPPFMSLNSATGVLSGSGSGNDNYNFTITVTDSEQHHVSKSFTLKVTAKPEIAFDYNDVKFDSSASGPKQSKSVAVGASGGGSLNVTITPDVPKPDWIKVEPPEATTPVEVKIQADPTNVASGSYTTRVIVTDKSGQAPPLPIQVTLDVLFQPPKLEFAPADLRLTAGASESVPRAGYLMVRNTGSGPMNVSAMAPSKTRWLAVAPETVTAPPGEWASFSVTANPASLSPDAYSGTVHLKSQGGEADVPVSLVIGDDKPRLETSFQGLQFYGRPGQAATAPQEIEIRNAGSGSLSWQASLIKDQGNFLVTPLSGTATPGSPSKITIQARPQNLASGIHYGLLRILAAGQLSESSQDIMLVANVVPTSTPMPELAPAGLIFPVRPGVVKSSQQIKVYTDSSSAVNFQGSVHVSGAAQWLSVTPSSGQVSSDTPATLSVDVSSFAVSKQGVYTGQVSVGFSGVLMRTIPVTMIVSDALPEPKQATLSRTVSAAAQRLVLTTTRPASRFRAMAGGPVPLSAVVTDDTGTPVADADVSVTFSTGDAALPMRLANSATGLYTATWIPASSGAVTLTLRATRANLAVETAELSGTVETSAGVPVIARNGVLNNLNGILGAPLAPGTVASIYGAALTSKTVTQVPVPLPVELGDTRVYIGGRPAPLYYVTPGQLAVQIPTELAAGTPQAVTVVSNNAVSVPAIVNLAAASPGIAAFADGKVIAQHLDYSLITASAPARPGEWITLYLVGMGATDVTVASGQQSPALPLANVKNPVAVTIDGAEAQVYFAGLTPGGIGLYQINCKVPDSARLGDLPLIVTQNGVAANSVIVPVAK